jgi:hypothetical protein
LKKTGSKIELGGVPQAWYGAGLLSLWSKGRVGSIPTPRATIFKHYDAVLQVLGIITCDKVAYSFCKKSEVLLVFHGKYGATGPQISKKSLGQLFYPNL